MGKRMAVLIADIVRSKRMKDRAKVQRMLQKVLMEISRTHRGSILAPLTLTRGDEFEGALRDAQSCYFVFGDIEEELYPIKVRAGVGIGEIDTAFSRRVTEMDGPAFHRARRALGQVKKGRSGVLICSGDEEVDKSINPVLRLLWAVRNGWTHRQREVIDYYFSRGSPTHAEVAKHFGVSQPAVTKILSAGHAKAVGDVTEFLMNRLSKFK